MITQNIAFHLTHINILLSVKYNIKCFFHYGLKNESGKAVVNEPSVFEPLKFYFIMS